MIPDPGFDVTGQRPYDCEVLWVQVFKVDLDPKVLVEGSDHLHNP